MAPLLLLLPTILAGARAQATATSLPAICAASPLSVPRVPTRDQSPTPKDLLGRCTERVEAHTRLTSAWCRAPSWREFVPATTTATATSAPPPARSLAAEACAKRGRMTVYRGPALGYDDDSSHVGACNATLAGSATHALVAVSTAHLSHREGAWEPTLGACGSCVCVRVAGADAGMNEAVAPMYGANVARAKGASFMGVVGDRCGECEDEHLDVLLDRPFSFAPYDRANADGQDAARAQAAELRPGTAAPPIRPANRRAPLVNRLRGPRIFSAADSLRGQGRGAPEAVGVYVADWQWAPCEWTHSQCAAMWRRLYGSADAAWPPPVRSGVDSDTGADVASPGDDRSFCCGEAEPNVVVPEVSDALPEAVRAAVLLASARAAAAAGAAAAAPSAEDRLAAAASAALAAAWSAPSGGGATGGGSGVPAANATEEGAAAAEAPMFSAADEFAAQLAAAGPSSRPLLASRSGAGGGGAALLAAAGTGKRGSSAAAGGQGSVGVSEGEGGGMSGGKIAGIVVGSALGAAALGATAWVIVQRRQAAAAEEAAVAAAVAAAAGASGGKKKGVAGGVPAYVKHAPPASGNGAEMGGR
jgi:hypothetical protein